MQPWQYVEGHGWLHRPLWMRVINELLRLVQPRPLKWVIYAECEGGDNTNPHDPPRVLRYGFGRILHLPRVPNG